MWCDVVRRAVWLGARHGATISQYAPPMTTQAFESFQFKNMDAALEMAQTPEDAAKQKIKDKAEMAAEIQKSQKEKEVIKQKVGLRAHFSATV